MDELTRLLAAIDTGQEHATDDLLPLVYAELRKLAAARLALEPAGQTLQPTALVHEAYLRLMHGHSPDEQSNGSDSSRIHESEVPFEEDQSGIPQRGPQWKSRAQFFAAAAITIRRILIDHARRKKSLKHGGEFVRHNIDDFPPCLVEPQEDLLALDEALTKLADIKPQGAELVQLLYFGGLTLAEAAETLDISVRTASRLWAYSRAWLRRELADNTTSVTD
ncbi:RNA polymerase sigma factor [Planctopirus limnophila DSM 3776]|uniref:RNA polymerase sigma factor n=1 Tax=Planctopirus limnophila (strain ATCC 43296 / DSM 3776 / IFAM 1008 / Mu 290) TaxID=521674 RepID=D5SZ11_PLAL2|nr:sigma-70 family RNA polymerase sigma factor [Planctopirus limnophila]ADG69912.1 RNA polymerase sigma factor [Planctopirus limnophila DSM 3776]